MNLPYSLIAFDLDGTLAESKQPLDPKMGELLIRLGEKATVVIISGGSFGQFKRQFIPFLPFETTENCRVLLLPTSGSQRYEYDREKRDWIKKSEVPFPAEYRQKVFDFFARIIASGAYDIPEEIYGDQVEDRSTQITFSALGQNAPLDKKKVWDPDEKKRQAIISRISGELPDVTASIGGTTSIDILPKGFTKAVGLKNLLKEMNLKMKDLVFVGDALFPGGNDATVREAGFETIATSGPEQTSLIITKWLT